MIDKIVEHGIRKYSDIHKRRFKLRFYEMFYLKEIKTRIFAFAVSTIILVIVLIKVLKEPQLWWYIPVVLLLIIVGHFSASWYNAFRSTLYMDQTIIIPKKYNRIALLAALVLFILTFLLMYLRLNEKI